MSEFDKEISKRTYEEIGKVAARMSLASLVFLAAYYEHICFTIVFCTLWLKQRNY